MTTSDDSQRNRSVAFHEVNQRPGQCRKSTSVWVAQDCMSWKSRVNRKSMQVSCSFSREKTPSGQQYSDNDNMVQSWLERYQNPEDWGWKKHANLWMPIQASKPPKVSNSFRGSVSAVYRRQEKDAISLKAPFSCRRDVTRKPARRRGARHAGMSSDDVCDSGHSDSSAQGASSFSAPKAQPSALTPDLASCGIHFESKMLNASQKSNSFQVQSVDLANMSRDRSMWLDDRTTRRNFRQSVIRSGRVVTCEVARPRGRVHSMFP
ncbi:hypothetical protein EVAR_87794_1 [Eumeta japonica]|uniref:Uncharacterized protein n=1 Tax=Eumeta variegata TaxID=151549 RepID=A0A4C1X398_EUMVA|nr:hypothetical protein EVAR_87794_1 [Eumeta japonica]